MTITLIRRTIPTQSPADVAEQVARKLLTPREQEPRAKCGCLVAALELTQGECSHNNWLTPQRQIRPSEPPGWVSDAGSVEFILALADVFRPSGWAWRVTALDRCGRRTFHAAWGPVRVSSTGGGVEVWREDADGRVVVRHRLRRGVAPARVLAVAEGLDPQTD